MVWTVCGTFSLGECKNFTDQVGTVTGQMGINSFVSDLLSPGQARNEIEEYKLIYPAVTFFECLLCARN